MKLARKVHLLGGAHTTFIGKFHPDFATQRSIDPFTFPCLFARRAKVYKEAFGLEDADLAKVVAKAYANANKNPFAHMRTFKMTEENAREASDKNPAFLENAEYKA